MGKIMSKENKNVNPFPPDLTFHITQEQRDDLVPFFNDVDRFCGQHVAWGKVIQMMVILYGDEFLKRLIRIEDFWNSKKPPEGQFKIGVDGL